MKIFLDTAEIKEIKQAAETGLIDGVTTNPSLIAKSGRKFADVIKEIVKIVDGPISAEVISLTSPEMLAEAHKLAKIHKNITIKLPMVAAAMPVVKQLTKEKIKTNVTLIFSANQALLAAKAGATFVSPFVGRLDDIAEDGMNLVADILNIYQQYGFKTQVIAASIRHPLHVMQAAAIGTDIATIPFKVFNQMFTHPLTTNGIEKFLSDWKSVKK
ncbi:MAG: fructose-6-phosphate aldolase [Patescibacteria group bacterium]|jgi:transaldolase